MKKTSIKNQAVALTTTLRVKNPKVRMGKSYTLLTLLFVLLCLIPGSAQQTIFNFDGWSGKTPYGSLLQGTDGHLYGMTNRGDGMSYWGTIFKINIDGTGHTILHNFGNDPNDGKTPYGTLIQGADGYLYGMTIAFANGGSIASGTIFKINTDGSAYTTLFYFHDTNGGFPLNSLIQGTDGLLYGMTQHGGSGYVGTIFKINTDGTGHTILQNFNFTNGSTPLYSSLTQGADGTLYGMTSGGGPSNSGIIFKINTDGSGFTIINNFNGTNGKAPNDSLIFGEDGLLYGMTSEGGLFNAGTVFKIKTNGTQHTVLHSFNTTDGASPQGSLVQLSDGSLRGMTYSGGINDAGTIFKIKADGTGYAVVVNLYNTSGSNPYGSLIQATDGNLYGMTSSGGSSDDGTIFKITPLTMQAPAVAASNITFSNVISTSMTVSFKPGSGSQRLVVMKAGSAPSFVPENNTAYSGNLGNGESVAYNGTDSLFNVSSLQPNTEYFFKFFEFNSDSTATQYMIANAPVASKRTVQKRLLAVMSAGGTSGYGTIVSVNPDGSDFGLIYQFHQTDGASPKGSLIQAPDGWIYGVTSTGEGSTSGGTIFKIKADGTNHTVLHSFQYAEGIFPENSLTLTADGTLFGMTHIGGSSGYRGTIFKMNTNGTGFTVLQNFNVANGADAYGKLTQLSDGSLVGMTQLGGSPGLGIIFKIHSDGSGFSIIHNFNGSEGGFPLNSLIQGLDGSIVGMTNRGGTSDVGTIFKMNVDGSGYTVIHNCNTAEGSYPLGELVQSADGTFWGTTRLGGSFNLGTIFKINADGSGYTVLYNFNGVDGASPQGGSLVIYNNKLFGLTALGGTFNLGVMFSYDLTTSTYDKFRDLGIASGNKPYFGAPLFVEAPPLPPLEKPTVPASNISFSNVLSTSMTVTFNPGNGTGHLVIMRPGGAPIFGPVDNTTYSGALGHSQVVVFDGTEHTVNVKDLQSYRTYYFTVFEYISDGVGHIKYLHENAPVKSQRTRLLPEVYLTKPGNGAINQMIQITLKAKPVEGATIYTYEVSPDASFANPKIVNGGSTLLIDSLQYNTLYYVHVKTNLRADYGKVTTFSTRTAESLAYVTSPANNAINVSPKIAVASNKVPGASEYTIQLSESNDFSTVAFEATGLSRILHFTGLKNSTTYYSRVRVNLSSSFGGVRSFTTVANASTARSASVNDFNPSAELMEFEVRVYPNPFQGKLTLYIESSKYDVATIKLMDINGRVVHESSEKTNTTIEVEKNFVGGVYLLHANSGTQSKWIRVVKIQ